MATTTGAGIGSQRASALPSKSVRRPVRGNVGSTWHTACQTALQWAVPQFTMMWATSSQRAYPTNRALSSHRAISVVEQMEKNGIEPKRLSTRGFGEYRPLEPNAPNKKGTPKNRRVEIYIVSSGA